MGLEAKRKNQDALAQHIGEIHFMNEANMHRVNYLEKVSQSGLISQGFDKYHIYIRAILELLRIIILQQEVNDQKKISLQGSIHEVIKVIFLLYVFYMLVLSYFDSSELRDLLFLRVLIKKDEIYEVLFQY